MSDGSKFCLHISLIFNIGQVPSMVMLMDYPDVLEQSVPSVKDMKFHMNTEIHPFMQQLECLSCSSSFKTSQENFKNENTCSWFASIP